MAEKRNIYWCRSGICPDCGGFLEEKLEFIKGEEVEVLLAERCSNGCYVAMLRNTAQKEEIMKNLKLTGSEVEFLVSVLGQFVTSKAAQEVLEMPDTPERYAECKKFGTDMFHILAGHPDSYPLFDKLDALKEEIRVSIVDD